MPQSQRVVHFEIVAEQPERALRFYADTFGWKANKWEGTEDHDYWLLTTGDEGQMGINGGLGRAADMNLAPTTVNTIQVPSVEEATARVAQHGGTVVVPRFPLPGIGYLAYCKDTEGITFGLIEFAASRDTSENADGAS